MLVALRSRSNTHGTWRPAPALPRHRAEEADEELLRLSALESRQRRLLGRAAARFRMIRGHRRLGFVRIGDYARERLGISGREMQSLAFVSLRLRDLPRTRDAFHRGELSWSQTRLLCAAANADTEADLLEKARGCTVADLANEICGSISGGEARAEIDDVEDTDEGEARVSVTIRCPARVAATWRRAIELARRMLGTQAPTWQAAEAIAAEAVSAMPVPDVAAEAPDSPRRAAAANRRLVPRTRARIAATDHPDDLDLERRLDSADAFALDAAMRALVRESRTLDARLGKRLRRFVDLRHHRALGYASFDEYARERLGTSVARARALIAIARRGADARELAAAYESGALSWVRALTLLPVARGEHEAAWLRRAGEVTVRRLAEEVEWALDVRDRLGTPSSPPEHGQRLHPVTDLQIGAHAADDALDRRVTFFGPASTIALFRAVVRTHSEPDEPGWKGLERLLAHAVAEWSAQPGHRDPIFAREGWRCAVPGCSSRRNLQDHHLMFRSRGGGNERDNRVAICVWHHLHGIHEGIVRAAGAAPDAILWELGRRPGEAPLMSLIGERYLSIFDN